MPETTAIEEAREIFEAQERRQAWYFEELKQQQLSPPEVKFSIMQNYRKIPINV